PLGHQPRKALEQLIAEGRIRLAAGENRFAVELEHLRVFVGPRLETPGVRRYQPRPAENGAGVERLQLELWALESRHLYRDPAAANHIEVIGLLAVVKQYAVPFDVTTRGVRREDIDDLRRKPREERIAGDSVADRGFTRHRFLLGSL